MLSKERKRKINKKLYKQEGIWQTSKNKDFLRIGACKQGKFIGFEVKF